MTVQVNILQALPEPILGGPELAQCHVGGTAGKEVSLPISGCVSRSRLLLSPWPMDLSPTTICSWMEAEILLLVLLTFEGASYFNI